MMVNMNSLQILHGQVEVECDNNPSREISIVRTKLEEAMYWLARDLTKKKYAVNPDDILDP